MSATFATNGQAMGLSELAGLGTRAPMKIGYARVSTEDQNLSLQFDALHAAGCDLIFADEGVSGALPSRPALNNALAMLQPGDVLVTWRLDRLGRSLSHLVEVMDDLHRRKIEFRSLTEAIDTTSAMGRLCFHVIAALAEFERNIISERTKAGMASVRNRGGALGRPPKLTDEQVRQAKAELAAGTATKAELACRFGVSLLTQNRALKRIPSLH